VAHRYYRRRDARRWERPFWEHERKAVRRASNRQARHQARMLIHSGEYDVLPKPPRTEGWLTW